MKKILLAEDDNSISNILYSRLHQEKYLIKSARNGKEALDLLANDTFDLILLDLLMPEVSGVGVLKKMGENGDKTPVIVISNFGQDSDKNEALGLGAIKYFVKSDTEIEEIVDFVNKTIGG